MVSVVIRSTSDGLNSTLLPSVITNLTMLSGTTSMSVPLITLPFLSRKPHSSISVIGVFTLCRRWRAPIVQYGRNEVSLIIGPSRP